MKTHYSYDPTTDSLYICLRDLPSRRTREVAPDVMVDYGADGDPVGYDIQHASTKLELIGRLVIDGSRQGLAPAPFAAGI